MATYMINPQDPVDILRIFLIGIVAGPRYLVVTATRHTGVLVSGLSNQEPERQIWCRSGRSCA